MLDNKKIRKDFPMLNNNIKMQEKDLIFLDNASTTFKPNCVLDTIKCYYNFETSNSHRGDYDLCFNIDNKIAETRQILGRFINANPNEIVFTSGASMSMNLIAYGFGVKYLTKEDEVLLTQAEHASNVLPWFKVHELTGCKISYIPLTSDGRITLDNVKKAITKRTKIISMAHVSNVLGYINDVKAIAKIAHEHNIIFVCDGAQSVPHMEIDVKDLDVDFLVFSGHKMCGPTGIGVLYGKYDLLDKMDPLMSGGGMNAKFDMCGDVSYLKPPERFEAGTINIEGILGLGAATKYLMNLGMSNIRRYETKLRQYLISKLKNNSNVIIYNQNAEAGILTFNVKGVFAQDEATYLNSKGIAIRSGQHCAKILIDFLGVVATCRASIYFYTSKEEIDKFVDAINDGGDFLDAYFS